MRKESKRIPLIHVCPRPARRTSLETADKHDFAWVGIVVLLCHMSKDARLSSSCIAAYVEIGKNNNRSITIVLETKVWNDWFVRMTDVICLGRIYGSITFVTQGRDWLSNVIEWRARIGTKLGRGASGQQHQRCIRNK